MGAEGSPVGDDDVLVAICTRGRTADAQGIRAQLRAWLGTEVDLQTLEEQLERLRRAGLVRRFYPNDQPVRFHLTELGVQRLRDREMSAGAAIVADDTGS